MSLYSATISHEGLHKYRVIKGDNRDVVMQKAQTQAAAWDEEWERKQATMKRESTRNQLVREKEQMKALAAERTAAVQKELQGIDETLMCTLSVDDRVDWDKLKIRTPFPKPRPVAPEDLPRPREPKASDPQFRPTELMFDAWIKSRREKRQSEANVRFEQAHLSWQQTVGAIYESELKQKADFDAALAAWEAERAEHDASREAINATIDARREMYERKDPGAIVDYCDLVLTSSHYPDYFPQDFDIDYNPDNEILVVDYVLPAPSRLPQVKEIKYVQSRNELVEVNVSESEANKRYDSLLYQIALRSIHELFEADVVDAIRAVAFNGWVRSIDPANGRDIEACVLSVQAQKEPFLQIDLSRVDAKACFKSLKGVGSSKLHSLAPVAPVITMDKNDRRFVAGREVIGSVDESMNLAAMDWEDFEHLIRELFESEFASGGGEVKVTQASRDGGVDAVAFDPDPIRGGKIVIQAKRYTNTVGVAAVRDLYGTVVNEGATKGILVTTSDYGPDAYEFAKAKPLTLLNGANLLHLLEKHGHRARIDIREARLQQA